MRKRLLLALLIAFLAGATYVYAQVVTGGHRGTSTSSVVSVDENGFMSVPNSLPFRVKKEILPNGLTRYSEVTFDNGQEKVIAFADY